MRFLLSLSVFISASFGTVMALANEGITPFSAVAIHPERSATATAVSLNDTTLSAQVQAPVEQYHVRVSQRVRQGDLLVSLDCAAYDLSAQMAKARVRAATARLNLAQSQRARAAQLLKKSLTSQETVDTRVAEALSQEAVVDELNAAFKRAELDVRRCDITAPFDGIVTGRLAAIGQLANIGAALVTMVDTGEMELTARVPYLDAQLMVGVDTFVFDFGGQLPVKLHNLGGVIDANSRSQEIRFEFTKNKPLPGTAGKLLWADPRTFLPAKYIVMRNKQLGYFTVNANVAEFVPVPAAVPGRPAVMSASPEMKIVVSGLGVLQHGQAL